MKRFLPVLLVGSFFILTATVALAQTPTSVSSSFPTSSLDPDRSVGTFLQSITDWLNNKINPPLEKVNKSSLPPLTIEEDIQATSGATPAPANPQTKSAYQYKTAVSVRTPEQTSVSFTDSLKDFFGDIFGYGNKKAEEFVASQLPRETAEQVISQSNKAMVKALPILQCAHLPAGVGGCSETGSLIGEPAEISATPQIPPSPGQYPIITPGVGCGVDASNEGYAPAQCTLARGWCSLSCLKQFTGGDAEWAARLSQICFLESGGDPQAGPNKGCLRGISQEYSVGLFQINLIDRCPGGIRNEWAERKSCTIVDAHVFDQCVANMEIPQNNIQKAIGLSGNGNNWTPWLCASEMCGFLNSTRCPYNRR